MLGLDPVALFDYLAVQGVPDVSHILPELISFGDMLYLREKLSDWRTDLDVDAKLQRAKIILKGRHEVDIELSEEEEDEDNDVEVAFPQTTYEKEVFTDQQTTYYHLPLVETTKAPSTSPPTTESTTSPPTMEMTTILEIPTTLQPYTVRRRIMPTTPRWPVQSTTSPIRGNLDSAFNCPVS